MVLLRLGSGLPMRLAMDLLGLDIDKEEDTARRSFTYTLYGLTRVLRTTLGRPWTEDMIEQ